MSTVLLRSRDRRLPALSTYQRPRSGAIETRRLIANGASGGGSPSVSGIAQLRRTLNESPQVIRLAHLAGVLQGQREKSARGGQSVLQPKWELEEALRILRMTPEGRAAARRVVDGSLRIVHHVRTVSFPRYVVINGDIVPSDRPLSMRGFGDADAVHISDEMDAVEAGAMIVHESTHSTQKQEGGIHALWRQEPPDVRSARRGEVELQMEVEAHENQYRHELNLGILSDKARECLNDSGTDIDTAKVKAQVQRLYRTEAPANQGEADANARTKQGQQSGLREFLAGVKAEYSADEVKKILVRMHKREQEPVNPYALDMPAYGSVSSDPVTGLPPGAMPYIL